MCCLHKSNKISFIEANVFVHVIPNSVTQIRKTGAVIQHDAVFLSICFDFSKSSLRICNKKGDNDMVEKDRHIVSPVGIM